MSTRHPTARLAAPALALVALLATGMVQAREDEVDLALGVGNLSTQTNPAHSQAWEGMVGYRFDQRQFGVQAVGMVQSQVYHRPVVTGGPALYDFDKFFGVQGVAYFPLTAYWDLYGAAGVGMATYASATPGAAAQHKTDTVLGVGIRWLVVPHMAISLDVTHLDSAGVTSPAIRGEFSF